MPPRQKRERNKSSPCEANKKQKPNKFAPLSEGSFISEESELENWEESSVYVAPPTTDKMVSTLSKDDLKELVTLLGKEFKKDLVKDITAELKNEIIKEVNEAVQIETQSLRDDIVKLQRENSELKESILNNFLYTDECEQYTRRMCLDISGIPGDRNDPKEDVAKKILDHMKTKSIDLKLSDIDKCHRKGKFKDDFLVNRKVIVKFTNSSARQRIYDARKDIGDGIFVQENLTPYREKLSFEARQLVRDKILDKTWISGCKVYGQYPSITNVIPGKTEPGVKIHIRSMNTIDAIRNGGLVKP